MQGLRFQPRPPPKKKYHLTIDLHTISQLLDVVKYSFDITPMKNKDVWSKRVVVILGQSVFKQQHTQELKQWHKH